jgi:hypothetical protein
VLDSELDENNHAYYTAVLVTGDWAPMWVLIDWFLSQHLSV